MSTALETWLIEKVGLISVVGALIIFFSWAVTNTLGQRYTRVKQSVEAADNTFRLYTSLYELRSSLNSVAMEAVYAREAAERAADPVAAAAANEVRLVTRDFNHTRSSAHQIRELMSFASQTLDYSSSVDSSSDTSSGIQGVHKRIYTLYAQVLALERAVENLNGSPPPPLQPLRHAVENYVQFVRKEAIPQVRGLYEEIVALSNTRRIEGQAELERVKARASISANIALVLYVFGSALVLGGQYIDKVHKARQTSATALTKPLASSPPSS